MLGECLQVVVYLHILRTEFAWQRIDFCGRQDRGQRALQSRGALPRRDCVPRNQEGRRLASCYYCSP